jgi:hypothetical protein
VVRAEDSDLAEFRRVVSACASRLEPLAETDRMRWRDLLWILVSWVIRRRLAGEADELTAAVAASQKGAQARQEATAVSETVKESWVMREVAREAAKRERLVKLEALREALVDALREPFGELPPATLSSIQACEDAAKLRAAIVRVRVMKSLDEFQL